MASNSSREAALERRKALTNGGKKAVGRYTSGSSRVRSAADARPTRTNTPVAPAPTETAVAAASAPAASNRSRRSAGLSLGGTPSSGERRSAAKPVANPSRDLVLARREALSRNGKRADNSKDRNRAEAAKATKGQGGEPLLNAMKGQVFESPRGQMYIDAQTRDVVHSVYVRRVERIDNQLWNVEIQTTTDVKDIGKSR